MKKGKVKLYCNMRCFDCSLYNFWLTSNEFFEDKCNLKALVTHHAFLECSLNSHVIGKEISPEIYEVQMVNRQLCRSCSHITFSIVSWSEIACCLMFSLWRNHYKSKNLFLCFISSVVWFFPAVILVPIEEWVELKVE